MTGRLAEAHQGDCAICGAMSVLVRYELFRYVVPLKPSAEGEPPILFDAAYRCMDRARCQGDVEALAKAWDPKDGPAPRWNIADGPAAMSRPQSSWAARAGRTAPQDLPEIAPPVAVPVTPTRPAAPRRRSSAPKSPQRVSW